MNPLSRFLSSRRRLTRTVHVTRELHQLNDSIAALMLHFNIPTLVERRTIEREAEAEQKRIEGDPSLLRQPSETERLVEALRERRKRGEEIGEDEVLAAARALEDDEAEKTALW